MKLISDSCSDKKMLKFWLFGLLVVVLGYFVYNMLDLIFLIIGAYIISIVLESLILFFQKIRLHRGLAIVLAYIVFMILLFGLILFVVPFLLTQITELISIGLGHIAGFQEILATKGVLNLVTESKVIPGVMKDYFLTYFSSSDVVSQIQNILQHNLSEIISVGKEYVQIFGSLFVDFVSGLAGMALDFMLFITLAILFSIEKESIMKFLSNIAGNKSHKLIYMKLERIYKKLAIWLKARLLLSFFMALAVWFMLIFMSWFGVDIPNKLGLAVLAGLLDIIPYIGPFISGILIFVISMIYNAFFPSIIAVSILFGINLLENNVVVPVMMNKALGVSPTLILLSMIFGAAIMGFMGVLLAVPIAVIVTLLLQNEKEFKSEVKKEEDDIKYAKQIKNSKRKIEGKVKKTPLIEKTIKKNIKKTTFKKR